MAAFSSRGVRSDRGLCTQGGFPVKKWMKNTAAAGGSMLLLAASFPVASAASSGSPIKGTITVLTNRTDMQANGMLAKYSREFEAKYPGTTVKWETFVQNSTVQTQMSGGVYPDVMLILPSITPQQLPEYFTPLDSLGLDNQINNKNWDEYNGKVYGIASFGDVSGIVYNKATFRKAGIRSVPRTLAEFYKDCALLKKAGIVPIAMNYTDKWPLGNYGGGALAEIIARNPNYMNTMVSQKAPFSMSSPEGQALAIARKIIYGGWAEHDWKNTNWANSKMLMAKGKVSMMFLGNWAVPQIIADGTPSSNVGFFPFPASNNGKNVAILGPDWVYAVNKNSHNIPTAKAFVKWELLDSGFANYAGGIPTIKSQKSNIPQLAAFEKLASAILPAVPTSAAFTNIANSAQLDFSGGGLVQTALLAPSLSSAFQQFNQAWANAKSMAGN
jgi:raffinose/stachyose/melibiose transport system substrate-binding protein